VFFTNHESRKGRELDANPWAAGVLTWHAIGRQARVGGPVERVSAAEADAYWATRARGSQLAARASPQSAPVADRAALDALFATEEERWAGGPVPRPDRWGGYRIVPDEVEVWQGRRDRFHDRFRYERVASGWRLDRLGP
jgi:pyridoxamine 5'-phosphate oxidase